MSLGQAENSCVLIGRRHSINKAEVGCVPDVQWESFCLYYIMAQDDFCSENETDFVKEMYRSAG